MLLRGGPLPGPCACPGHPLAAAQTVPETNQGGPLQHLDEFKHGPLGSLPLLQLVTCESLERPDRQSRVVQWCNIMLIRR